MLHGCPPSGCGASAPYLKPRSIMTGGQPLLQRSGGAAHYRIFPPIAVLGVRSKTFWMDILDALAVFGLEWVSDKIEERYGRTAAWWLTLVMCLSFLAAV